LSLQLLAMIALSVVARLDAIGTWQSPPFFMSFLREPFHGKATEESHGGWGCDEILRYAQNDTETGRDRHVAYAPRDDKKGKAPRDDVLPVAYCLKLCFYVVYLRQMGQGLLHLLRWVVVILKFS